MSEMRSRISSWPRYLLLDNTRSLRYDRGKGRAISMGLLFGNSDVMFRFSFFFFLIPIGRYRLWREIPRRDEFYVRVIGSWNLKVVVQLSRRCLLSFCGHIIHR